MTPPWAMDGFIVNNHSSYRTPPRKLIHDRALPPPCPFIISDTGITELGSAFYFSFCPPSQSSPSLARLATTFCVSEPSVGQGEEVHIHIIVNNSQGHTVCVRVRPHVCVCARA